MKELKEVVSSGVVLEVRQLGSKALGLEKGPAPGHAPIPAPIPARLAGAPRWAPKPAQKPATLTRGTGPAPEPESAPALRSEATLHPPTDVEQTQPPGILHTPEPTPHLASLGPPLSPLFTPPTEGTEYTDEEQDPLLQTIKHEEEESAIAPTTDKIKKRKMKADTTKS
ncbi:hypothetical protein UPYG_G00061030, partial [Umbra pygmaea]